MQSSSLHSLPAAAGVDSGDVDGGGYRQFGYREDVEVPLNPAAGANAGDSAGPSSWYRLGVGQPHSGLMESLMGGSSLSVLRDSPVSALVCTLIVALGPLQSGFTLGFSASTAIRDKIVTELNLTASQLLAYLSLSYAGAMVGAITSGVISECIGRKGSLMIASIPSIMGWITISFAKGTSFLYIGQLLEGFGVGIISYTVPTYIAEVSPQDTRGSLVSVNQLSIAIGLLLAYLLGLVVPWKLLAIVGLLPCSLLIFGLFFIPESPRWLAKMDSPDFETSLQVIRGYDQDITPEVNEIKQTLTTTRMTIGFAELRQKKYLNPIIIGIGLLVLQQLCGINGILFYAGHVFDAAGVTYENCSVGAVQVIGTAVCTWLVDKVGRRVLLIISSVGMMLSLSFVAAVYFLKSSNSQPSQFDYVLGVIALVGVLVYIGAFSLGLGAIPWIIMSEIFPLGIKSMGGSIATFANWTFTTVVALTASYMISWSAGGTFTIYVVACAITLLFVVIWVPETKGRSLEEVPRLCR